MNVSLYNIVRVHKSIRMYRRTEKTNTDYWPENLNEDNIKDSGVDEKRILNL